MKKYFLAANSCKGFVSNFEDCYEPNEDWYVYIIKGGPGTGKSTFMKKIADYALDNNLDVESCPCSSDPDSLDAVIIEDIKTVIMDGTAPHTVDPKYPAAVETILNFGEFWNNEKIKAKRKEIIKITNKNKAYHKTASRYLKTAGYLLEDNFNIGLSAINKAKTDQLINRLDKKYFKSRGKQPQLRTRYLSGVSPKGRITFTETVNEYENLVILNDKLGAVAHTVFSNLTKRALNKGYKVISVKNAYLPEFCDHLIIPELNLAFLKENSDMSFQSDVRRIHARRFMNEINSNKIKINGKLANSLIDAAIENLKKAKDVHDDLEAIYIDAMDFKALDKFTKSFIQKNYGTA